MNAYEEVADRIRQHIEKGILRAGDRLPSLRRISGELGFSVNTVKEAYWKLEDEGLVRSVPQSGYFVQEQVRSAGKTVRYTPVDFDPHKSSLCSIFATLHAAKGPTPGICLGIAQLSARDLPTKKIEESFRSALQLNTLKSADYCMSPGYTPLRDQIARLYIPSGPAVSPDEIIVTNGCHEAIFLSLMTICREGDIVAVESPVYFSFLTMLEQLRLRVIEIPTNPVTGMNLDILEYVLSNHPVRAVITTPNFSNPTGALMPEENKKRLADAARDHDVFIIEDDIYGELFFHTRPATCKRFDTNERVILCSSFSKTISPGMRIGWVATNRFFSEINRLKTLLNIGTSAQTQTALTYFLQGRSYYERHLRRIRRQLALTLEEMRSYLLERLPEGTVITDPEGGFCLWITLPREYDTMDLYNRALEQGILIAPGALFTLQDQYTSSFRLNACNWDIAVRKEIDTLLQCIEKMEHELQTDYA